MRQLLATLTSTALFGFMCLAQAVQANTPIGAVHGNLVQGQVFAGERKLTSGAPIYEGDTIKTIGEGSVVLLLNDGTIWDIYDDSMLTIEKYQYSDAGRNDSATFRLDQGEAIYTSGELGAGNATVAIKTGDDTVYPEGTIISFTFVQTVSIVRVIQGRGRIRSRITQTTTTVTVNQYYVSAPSLGAPTVTTSTAVVTTKVTQAVENTTKTKAKGKGPSASSVATGIVTKVVTRTSSVTVSRGASTTTQTSTTTNITTTTPGAAGAGAGAGSGGAGGAGGGGAGTIVIPFQPTTPASPS